MGQLKIFDEKSGRTGLVPSENLGKALDRGYQLYGAGEQVKIQDPKTGRTGTMPTANLSKALNSGLKLASADWTDYGQAFTQGIATGVGKIADTAVAGATALGGAVLKHTKPPNMSGIEDDGLNEAAGNQLQDTAKDYWQNDKIAKVGSDLLDTGLNHEKGIRITKAAGEFATPMAELKALGLGVKVVTKTGGVANLPWVAKINKFLETPITGKNAGTFAGMNAGSEALKSDDPNTGGLENITRELGGALLGGLSIPAATGGLESVKEIGKLLLSREKLYESLVKRGNSALDHEAIEGVKNIGGELNAKTIYKENDVAAYIERVLPNKAYQIAAKNADSKIISSIEKTLNDELGTVATGQSGESTIRSLTSKSDSMIEKLYNERKAKNEALYQNAFDIIGMYHELPSTSNSVKAAMEVFKKTHAPSTSGTTETGQGITSSAMDGIIKKWGNSENKSLILMDGNREINVPILRGKQAPYEEMVAQLRSLKEQRRKAGGGYREYFKSVEAAIEKDINNANPEFFKRYKLASKDYAENIAPFIQLDAARALMSGEKPNFIWEHMNTPTNREEVRKALSIGGESGRKLFDTIKRTKAHAVITEKISKEGAFNQDKFIELFTQLKPEDDIVDLVTKETYSKIKKNALVLARKMNSIKEQAARIVHAE